MRIKTAHAAQRAGLHPMNFVVAIYQMVGGLPDCWPDVDDGYVDTLLALNLSHKFENPEVEASGTDRPSSASPTASEVQLCESAVRVLDKLERGDRWARNAISFDTLRNHLCRGVSDVDRAVEELVENGLVSPGGGRKGPYSLNPDRKGDIDRIVHVHRERAKP